MLGIAGVISIDCSTADVTLSVMPAETVPDTAVITVEPTATLVARPFEPAALLIVETVVVDELQTTDVVISWLLLSE